MGRTAPFRTRSGSPSPPARAWAPQGRPAPRVRPASEQAARTRLPPIVSPKRSQTAHAGRRPNPRPQPEAALRHEGSYVQAQREKLRREELITKGYGRAEARRARREERLKQAAERVHHEFGARVPAGRPDHLEEDDIMASLQRLDNLLRTQHRKGHAPEKGLVPAVLTASMEQEKIQQSLAMLDVQLAELAARKRRGPRGPGAGKPAKGPRPAPHEAAPAFAKPPRKGPQHKVTVPAIAADLDAHRVSSRYGHSYATDLYAARPRPATKADPQAGYQSLQPGRGGIRQDKVLASAHCGDSGGTIVLRNPSWFQT